MWIVKSEFEGAGATEGVRIWTVKSGFEGAGATVVRGSRRLILAAEAEMGRRRSRRRGREWGGCIADSLC